MSELKDRVALIINEWIPLKAEYALPNSTVGITDLWTVAYDMASIIKDQQARIEELEGQLNKARNWSQDFYDRCVKNRPKQNYLSAGMHSAVNDFDANILGKHQIAKQALNIKDDNK